MGWLGSNNYFNKAQVIVHGSFTKDRNTYFKNSLEGCLHESMDYLYDKTLQALISIHYLLYSMVV